MEWTKEFLTSYDINVEPQTVLEFIRNNASVQLTVPYNTPYNVSVTASLCGQNVSTDTELLYNGKAKILNSNTKSYYSSFLVTF